jgi:hypothetical protein
MRTSRGKLVTSIVLLAVLAPLAPAAAWHCGDHDEHGQMASGHDCSSDSGVRQRCAGLWASACCDFSSPSRPTKDVPGGFDLHARHFSAVASEADVGFPGPPPTLSALDLLVEDRAGPPPPRLLSSVLLI